MKFQGILRNGFVLMGRVSVEIELVEPDMTNHRDINSFFDERKGQRFEISAEEVKVEASR